MRGQLQDLAIYWLPEDKRMTRTLPYGLVAGVTKEEQPPTEGRQADWGKEDNHTVRTYCSYGQAAGEQEYNQNLNIDQTGRWRTKKTTRT
jgi:hypothetical protein